MPNELWSIWTCFFTSSVNVPATSEELHLVTLVVRLRYNVRSKRNDFKILCDTGTREEK